METTKRSNPQDGESKIGPTSSYTRFHIDKSDLPATISGAKGAIVYLPPVPLAYEAGIIARYGSLEHFQKSLLASPEFWKDVVQTLIAEPKNKEAVLELAAKLADVEKWTLLASSDPEAYRTELAANIGAYKSALNALCKISSHRPKDNERSILIRQIKDSKPDLSFGQVAIEFEKETGKSITANSAERFYKRESTSPIFFELLV